MLQPPLHFTRFLLISAVLLAADPKLTAYFPLLGAQHTRFSLLSHRHSIIPESPGALEALFPHELLFSCQIEVILPIVRLQNLLLALGDDPREERSPSAFVPNVPGVMPRGIWDAILVGFHGLVGLPGDSVGIGVGGFYLCSGAGFQFHSWAKSLRFHIVVPLIALLLPLVKRLPSFILSLFEQPLLTRKNALLVPAPLLIRGLIISRINCNQFLPQPRMPMIVIHLPQPLDPGLQLIPRLLLLN